MNLLYQRLWKGISQRYVIDFQERAIFYVSRMEVQVRTAFYRDIIASGIDSCQLYRIILDIFSLIIDNRKPLQGLIFQCISPTVVEFGIIHLIGTINLISDREIQEDT